MWPINAIEFLIELFVVKKALFLDFFRILGINFTLARLLYILEHYLFTHSVSTDM